MSAGNHAGRQQFPCVSRCTGSAEESGSAVCRGCSGGKISHGEVLLAQQISGKKHRCVVNAILNVDC